MNNNYSNDEKEDKSNNNDNNNNKTSKSSGSCGFNENIDEYGEGGNSLIKKMNDLNKKEYQTVKVQNKRSGEIKTSEDKINNVNNKNLQNVSYFTNKYIYFTLIIFHIITFNLVHI